MRDGSAAALLDELNEKASRSQLWPWVILGGAVAVLLSANLHPYAPFIVLAPLAFVVWWIHQRDALRVTTVLLYDLDEAATVRYQKLHDVFEVLTHVGRLAHIDAQGTVTDRRHHAGASMQLRRHVIRPQTRAPSRIRTNIEVPSLPLGTQTLYFFPDRVLVFESGKMGAVPYEQLRVSATEARFIEREGVPSDAKVVGRTWQYVNKNGSPDKRFRNNRELPVALYEELHLQSASGLNHLMQVSRIGTGSLLEAARQALVDGGASAAKAL